MAAISFSKSLSPQKKSTNKAHSVSNFDRSTQATVSCFDSDAEIQKILVNEGNEGKSRLDRHNFSKVKSESKDVINTNSNKEDFKSIEAMKKEIESLKKLLTDREFRRTTLRLSFQQL